MSIEELRAQLREINDRTSGNVHDDLEDAVDLLIDYVDDAEVSQLLYTIR
jgi:hypothetical protein